jgi:hypothetical protein
VRGAEAKTVSRAVSLEDGLRFSRFCATTHTHVRQY